MKKTILFLLLAWIAIYAGNHLLFKSVPKNSEVETALRSQPDLGRREVDSWGPYLPGVRAKVIRSQMSPQLTHYRPAKRQMQTQEVIRRLAENLAISQSSEVDRLPVSIPPLPARKPTS